MQKQLGARYAERFNAGSRSLGYPSREPAGGVLEMEAVLMIRIIVGFAALLALVLPGAAGAHLSVLRPSPSDAVTFHGHGGYSTDGGYPGSVVRAEVPAGSTVQQAYLYGTYESGTTPLTAPLRTIDFDGTTVEMTEIEDDNGYLPSTRADVTAQVAAKVGEGGGITSFGIDSDPSAGSTAFQGAALVVIYSNPSSPVESIVVLDGAAASAGDTATVHFTPALNTSAPGFSSTMAIGDGFSYQSPGKTHQCGPEAQDSLIEIDEQPLTSCAGGSDDGSANNRYLITVGGIGDSPSNPSNPLTHSEGTEDELYELTPFLHNGDTQMTIDTANPSGNDDLFLAVIAITANASVGIGNEVPPPAPPEPLPPELTSPPTASATGGATTAGTLTAQTGSFAGAESYTYQWQLCSSNESNSCTNIAGASGVQYTPSAADIGSYLRFVVTAINANGSTIADSALVGPVSAALSITSNSATTAPATAPGVCKSARSETIHWRTAKGVHLKHIEVMLNGRILHGLRGSARKTTVSLVGRGSGRVSVQIKGTGRSGRQYVTTRTYEPCIPGSGHPRLRSVNLKHER